MNFDFTKIHLRGGAGNGDPKDGLCLMQMVDWFDGRDSEITDHPSCACPVLSKFGVMLNDQAPSQEARDTLWPLVFQLLGSRDQTMEQARTDFLVVKVAIGPVADRFDALAQPHYANALRKVKTVEEVKTVAILAADAANKNACAALSTIFGATTLQYYWFKARDIFAGAIALGKHGECDPVGQLPRLKQIERILASSVTAL